jgi:hypothetical protein
MFGKEVVDSKHFYPMFAIICLVIIGLLSWSIWIPLLVVLPIALIIPFLVTFGKHLKYWRGFMFDWKTLVYSTIYAMTIATVAFVILINAIFVPLNGFYSSLTLMSVTLFVITGVFVYAVIYFKKRIMRADFNMHHVFVDLLVVGLIVCLVFGSLFIVLASSGLYDSYTNKNEEKLKSINMQMNDYKLRANEKSMLIFDELGSYYDENIIALNKDIETVKEKESAKPIFISCLNDNCFEFVSERLLIYYKYSIVSLVFKEQMNYAREISIELKENELEGIDIGYSGINDKSEYLEYLKKETDVNYFIGDVDELNVLLLKLDNEFSYSDMVEIMDELNSMSSVGGMVSVFDNVLSSKSILIRSASKMFMHTKASKQLFITLVKISLEAQKLQKLNPLLETVYTNKDVEESTNSKIIRNYLLYKYTLKKDEMKVEV